jgi:hypothetical protein
MEAVLQSLLQENKKGGRGRHRGAEHPHTKKRKAAATKQIFLAW